MAQMSDNADAMASESVHWFGMRVLAIAIVAIVGIAFFNIWFVQPNNELKHISDTFTTYNRAEDVRLHGNEMRNLEMDYILVANKPLEYRLSPQGHEERYRTTTALHAETQLYIWACQEYLKIRPSDFPVTESCAFIAAGSEPIIPTGTPGGK